ncbi:cation:proton antiporter [Salisediminibacterium beveridgei]|nr:sodium:proton antiporter [Salisediminibacterium beveridgei]
MDVLVVISLLLVGYLIFTLDTHKENVPVPVLLVLIGIGLSFVPVYREISLTGELMYDVFLPALLFVSAYQFPFQDFKRLSVWIISQATIGLLITVFALGGAIYLLGSLFFDLPFLVALLIAAILTPTDPVSVVSILKQSADDAELAEMVEGESLLNDGTSIVIFTLIAGMVAGEQGYSFGSVTFNFLFVILFGVLLGLVFGWLLQWAVHLTHDRHYQVMLSIIVAYGSFHLAELAGASGVIAVVTAGILLSRTFERSAVERHFRDSLDGFWTIIEVTLVSFLFLVIGIVSAELLLDTSWLLAFLILISYLLIRWVTVYGLSNVLPFSRPRVSFAHAAILSVAGLKGVVSVVLILTLEFEPIGDTAIVATISFTVVLMSVVLQSLLIHPLTKKLSDDS